MNTSLASITRQEMPLQSTALTVPRISIEQLHYRILKLFTCQLNEAFRIKVQPGDILGLELPPKSTDAGVVLFAMVVNGPTNYVLDQVLSSSIDMLSNETTTDQEFPQLVFEFESGIHNLLQH